MCRVLFGASTPSASNLSPRVSSHVADIAVDQMGVELGKVLAKAILAQLESPEDVKGHDSSVRFPLPRLPPTETNIFSSTDDWSYSLLPEVQERVNI